MASQSVALGTEVEEFAAPLVESGEFTNASDVLHAAMDALRERLDQKAYDEACVKAMQEGIDSGIYEGDIFEDLRREFGMKSRLHQ